MAGSPAKPRSIVRGVVHVKLKSYGGPVRFTVRGKADGSTTYYDEAVKKFVAYPAGAELNAVVREVRQERGITILTGRRVALPGYQVRGERVEGPGQGHRSQQRRARRFQ